MISMFHSPEEVATAAAAASQVPRDDDTDNAKDKSREAVDKDKEPCDHDSSSVSTVEGSWGPPVIRDVV